MITAYIHEGESVRVQALTIGSSLPPGTVWIDVLRPEEAERAAVSRMAGVDLPTEAAMQEIEASSRLYTEGAGVFMTTPVISRNEAGVPGLGLLTFVLTPGLLVTVRHMEPLWYAIFGARVLRSPELATTPAEALLGLLEAAVDRAADVLELVGAELDALPAQVFQEAPTPLPSHGHPVRESRARRMVRRRLADRQAEALSPDALRRVMGSIGRAGGLTNKVRDSLAGLERVTTFAAAIAGPQLAKDQKQRLKTIGRDIHSLVEQAGFQVMQTNFLLDATLGVINIQQTNIIKIFSVAAVAFLPPTLIASIYGMNFHHMPELDWRLGYAMAVGMMALSAVLPLLYFKWKKWL